LALPHCADIPTYILSVSENYLTLKSFFTSLRLLKYPLQAVVADDNYNIFESCKKVYPEAVTQLCQVHYKQNIKAELNLNNDDTYKPFMYEIINLFRYSKEEIRTAGIHQNTQGSQN